MGPAILYRSQPWKQLNVQSTRCAAWIWYRGDRFRGFQAQPGGQTVQQAFQDALRRAEVHATLSAPSGRTDLGVHARMQVLSLRIPANLTPDALIQRVGPELPRDAIGFVNATLPHPAFQAHWSATGKEYRYRFALGGDAPAEWAPFAWQVRSHPRFDGREPTAERLAEALGRATGTRDFSAFHEKTSVRKERTLRSATLHEVGGGIFEARLVGDAFARFQVRYLVGAAALVAAGVLSEPALDSALETGTPLHGVKAPAEALVLWEVHYPEALDPFPRAIRTAAPGLPLAPPFTRFVLLEEIVDRLAEVLALTDAGLAREVLQGIEAVAVQPEDDRGETGRVGHVCFLLQVHTASHGAVADQEKRTTPAGTSGAGCPPISSPEKRKPFPPESWAAAPR